MQLIEKPKPEKAQRRHTIKSSRSGGAPALKSFSSGTSSQEQRADGMSTLPHGSSLLFAPQRARKGHGQNLCCTRTWRKARPGRAEVRPAAGTHTQAVRPGGQHQDPLSSGQPPGLTATRGVQLETQDSAWCLSLAGELGHTQTHTQSTPSDWHQAGALLEQTLTHTHTHIWSRSILAAVAG